MSAIIRRQHFDPSVYNALQTEPWWHGRKVHLYMVTDPACPGDRQSAWWELRDDASDGDAVLVTPDLAGMIAAVRRPPLHDETAQRGDETPRPTHIGDVLGYAFGWGQRRQFRPVRREKAAELRDDLDDMGERVWEIERAQATRRVSRTLLQGLAVVIAGALAALAMLTGAQVGIISGCAVATTMLAVVAIDCWRDTRTRYGRLRQRMPSRVRVCASPTSNTQPGDDPPAPAYDHRAKVRCGSCGRYFTRGSGSALDACPVCADGNLPGA